MNRDVLDEAVKQLIQDVVQIQVGMTDVPDVKPTLPYAILMQSSSPIPEGSYADPEDMPYFDYVIKSVGRDHRETERTSSTVKGALVGRNGHGFSHDLVAEGFNVADRKTVSDGSVIKATGPTLFEKNDIYRICVTAGP